MLRARTRSRACWSESIAAAPAPWGCSRVAMSPDTSWRKRRYCMTEADCARPPRWGSSPLGVRLWSICVLGVFRHLLDHLRPLEKGACNDIIPDAVESDAVFTCNTRNLAATGDPNGSGAAPWLAYDAGENILQLDNSIVNLAAFYPPAILAIRF